MLFLCQRYPAFRIYNPGDGTYADFVAGRLEMEEDDPRYGAVLAEARRNPAVTILTSAFTCIACGATLGSKAELSDHFAENHFAEHVDELDLEHAKSRQVLLKSRDPFTCEDCLARGDRQSFGSADDLALHVRLLHAAPPVLDDSGNTVGNDGEAASTEPASVPAAKPSSRRPGERTK